MVMAMRWMVIALIMLGAAGSASAQAPDGMTVDDGFTFFTVENNSGSQDGRRVDEGWSLEADFRVFGTTTARSAFRFVVKQGRRTLGESTCEVGLAQHMRQIANGPPSFFVHGCRDRAQRITQTGEITVEVHFIDDATDTSTLLRTHQLLIRSATRVRGNGDPDSPLHYVDRNGEALSTVMHLQHSRAEPYFESRIGGVDGTNTVTMTINLTPDESHRSVGSGTHLRCTVDGERVEIPRDQVLGGEIRNVYVVQSWGRGRREEQESVQFRRFVLRLPLTVASTSITQTHDRWLVPNERDERFPHLNEHPGQWECEWREGRDVLRTWRWTVGADGQVAPHAEQNAGLSLGVNAYMVDTVIPDGGSPYETRVHRQSIAQRAFHGRGWLSPEGRALAAAVPQVGQPALAPRRAPRVARGR